MANVPTGAELTTYNATVDVTGTFGDWTLRLQQHVVPLLAQAAGGYHAEAPITVGDDDKLWVFWETHGQNGVGWKFTLALTPLDVGGAPAGDAITWSTSGTTQFGHPAAVNGTLNVKNMSSGGGGDNGHK